MLSCCALCCAWWLQGAGFYAAPRAAARAPTASLVRNEECTVVERPLRTAMDASKLLEAVEQRAQLAQRRKVRASCACVPWRGREARL